MALPCLPAEHIQPSFESLVAALPDDVDHRVTALVNYVHSTWIESRLWPASSWTAFKSSVRTNNDVEGWHNRLNRQTRNGKLDVYQLAPVLFQEAQYVSLQAVLVQEDRLRRYQRRTYKKVQGRLHKFWSAYTAGTVTTSALLRKCAHVLAPHF